MKISGCIIKPTVRDIAKKAHLSVGSVSRVLNNEDRVGADVRLKVLEAAKNLKYEPIRRRKNGGSASEKGLLKTGNIGLVLCGMADSLAHLPIIAEAIHGVERALAAREINLLFANLPKMEYVPAFLKSNSVDGLIVKSALVGRFPAPSDNAATAAILRMPMVWLLGKPEGAVGDVCTFDGIQGGRIAFQHLFEKGHRRVAFLNPRPGQVHFEALRKGFCDQAKLADAQIQVIAPKPKDFHSEWPLPAFTRKEEVLSLAEAWAQTPEKERATAIFVPSDSIAVQVYSALGALGFQIGRDVSLISCNNEIPLIQGLNPSLTTLNVQAETIGRRAVEQLLWLLADPAGANQSSVLIEPSLVEGGSVRAATGPEQFHPQKLE